MENFKLKQWEGKLPVIESIYKDERDYLKKKMALKFLLNVDCESIDFFQEIQKDEIFLGTTEIPLLSTIQNICPFLNENDYIYIDFDGFNTIDKITLNDFVNNLTNIWYPDSDDISIFDEKCEWVLNIYHYDSITFSLAPEILRCKTYHLQDIL